MKVLVIEDNPIDLKLVIAILRGSGHEVGGQMSAEGAIEAIRADRPDVILLDLNLPDIDSFSLVRALRQQADMREIPIMAVTAYPQRYDAKAALAAGCSAYVAKPINTRELVNQLRDLTTDRSSPDGRL